MTSLNELYPGVSTSCNVGVSSKVHTMVQEWSWETGRPMSAIVCAILNRYLPLEIEKYKCEVPRIKETMAKISDMEQEIARLQKEAEELKKSL